MSVPVPSTPTNPELREQAKRAVSRAALFDGPATTDEERERRLGVIADAVGEQVYAPVLEGLHAELDAAVIQRDKFGQLHLNEAKTHDETIRSLREAQAEIERLEQVAERATHLAGRVLSEFIQKGDPGGRLYYVIQAIRGETVMAWRQELAELSRPSVSDQTPATPDVGRCGEPAPRLSKYEGPRVWCALPAGHAGWHKADDSREWSRTDAAPSSVQGDTTEEA